MFAGGSEQQGPLMAWAGCVIDGVPSERRFIRTRRSMMRAIWSFKRFKLEMQEFVR
jgi:hypothetical protein